MRKIPLFFTLIFTLCGCSTFVSQPTCSFSSSSKMKSDDLFSSNNSDDESSSSYSFAESPFIKEYNEEEYRPFDYKGFVLKYDDSSNSFVVCDYQGVLGSNVCVEIPEYYNGLPITEIAPYVFRNKTIKELVLSKNINKVYSKSFSEGYILSISNDSPYFSVKNGCLFNKDQTELIMMIEKNYRLSIPKQVKVINRSFWDDLNVCIGDLSQIDVEEGNRCFASINGALFDKEMTKLIHIPRKFEEDLFLPKTIRSIPSFEVFDSRKYFKNIIVEDENPYFSSKDGMLYKGNFEELIYQPFSNETKKLILPDSTKTIHWTLRNLEEIVLNDRIEDVKGSAFAYCHSLKTTIFNDCGYIGSESNKYMCLCKIPYELQQSAEIGSITIHDDCRFICSYSSALKTQNNPYLYADETGVYSKDKKVVYIISVNKDNQPSMTLLPETETLKDDYGLSMYYTSVLSIKVGKIFKDLERLFSDHSNIRNVEFYDSSDFCSLENEMLLNKEKTILYRYIGESSEVVIPSTVRKITAFAFYQKYALNKITFNDYLEEIGDEAFYNLECLTEDITFPETLVSIGERAFYNCRLSTIRLGSNIRFIGFGAFANNFNSVNEIFLYSTNATIEELAFSRNKNAGNSHYVVIHLAFDNKLPNTMNWDESWCGGYNGVDGYPSSLSIGTYYLWCDSGYLLDWNYSL